MITLTDTAKAKIQEYMKMAEGTPRGVRVVASRQAKHTFRYDLSLVMDDDVYAKDIQLDQGEFTLFVDPQSSEWLEGTIIDYTSDLSGAGFTFDNPQGRVSWDDPVAQQVQQALDERVAPALASHGGWVDLLGIEGGAAVIEFGGGCQGCGMSQVTLRQGIEAAILEAVPEVNRVIDRTDHEAGENPYFE